jgi:hypothetical protein
MHWSREMLKISRLSGRERGEAKEVVSREQGRRQRVFQGLGYDSLKCQAERVTS